jgi:chromate transporter
MKDLFTDSEQRSAVTPLTPWQLLWIWTVIGVQSFGGGSATLYLIRQVAVERQQWLTDDDFTRYWGICQIAPGINILGLVILIGWRVAGVAGALLALFGLLLPSASITVALTAVYASIREAPLVRSAIAGVVPATVGLGTLLAFTMLRPLLKAAREEGRVSAAVAVALLLTSTFVAAAVRVPVLAILWGAGAVSAVARWQLMAQRSRPR